MGRPIKGTGSRCACAQGGGDLVGEDPVGGSEASAGLRAVSRERAGRGAAPGSTAPRATTPGPTTPGPTMPGPTTRGSALRGRGRACAIATFVAFAVWLGTAASASAFSAQGSVEQVDVTGLAPNAQMSLLSKSGATVSTRRKPTRREACCSGTSSPEEVPGSPGLDGRNVWLRSRSTRTPPRRGIPASTTRKSPTTGTRI